jgi:hypothetical protein
MIDKRELVLVAWSGDRQFLGVPSLQRSFMAPDSMAVAKRDIGIVWSILFTSPTLLPHHPSLPRLAAIVDTQVRSYLANDGRAPMLRLYERWQVPEEVRTGAWTAADEAMLGWGTFQLRDVPRSFRWPWSTSTSIVELAILFGVTPEYFHAGAEERVKLSADGRIEVPGPSSMFEDGEYPFVYGRVIADQWSAARATNKPLPEAEAEWRLDDDAFTKTAMKQLRALGGHYDGDSMYGWAINTPIGPLRYSVRNGAIFTRFENTEEAARQLGQMINPNSGKFNHYASSKTKSKTDEARRLVAFIANTIASLTPMPEESRVWEGAVRE